MRQTQKIRLTALIPFIQMFKSRWRAMTTGMLLGIITLAAGIALLGVSGWFLSAAAVAGLTALGIKNFNFYTPAAAVRFLAVLRTAGRYGERIVTHDATLKLLADIRVWLWQKLQPLPFHLQSGLKRGDILSRLLTDIDVLDQLYLRLLTPLLSFIILVVTGGLALAFWLPDYALYLVTGLLILGAFLPWFGFKLSRRAAVEELTAKRAYRNSVLEYCSHQAELKLFGLTDKHRRNTRCSEERIYAAQRKLTHNQALIQALLFMLHSAVVISALYVAAGASLTGAVSPPVVAMIALALTGISELLTPLALSSQYLSACALAAGRVNELTQHAQAEVFGRHEQKARSGKLEIQNLNLSYDDVNVLSGFELTVEPGAKLALTGRSGCGKTSVLAAVCRLIPCHQGVIKLDDIEISRYSERALRRSVTYIEQQPQIFSATLRDNLSIALPDDEPVVERDLERALADVGLAYLSESQGLDLWVSDGGRPLSGGESRRLALARALLRDAPVILLDEPTEGLDTRTGRKIIRLLFDIFSDKTVVMVTHSTRYLHLFDSVRVIEPSDEDGAGT